MKALRFPPVKVSPLLRLRLATRLLASGSLLTILAMGGCGGGGTGGTPNDSTPTPGVFIPTPTAIVVAPGGETILSAVRRTEPGGTVVVAAGSYPSLEIRGEDLQGPVSLLADTTGVGAAVGSGSVLINGTSRSPAISLRQAQDLVLDGFTALGSSRSGIEIQNSSGVTLRNIEVRQNAADGIVIAGGENILLFNSLVTSNGQNGVAAFGVSDFRLLQSTIAGHPRIGVAISEAPGNLVSDGVEIRNNIIDGSGNLGLFISESSIAVSAGFNLTRNGCGPGPCPANTLTSDPLFAGNTFYLIPPDDFCAGGSPAVDAGDPNTPAEFLAALDLRTTRLDGEPDCIGEGCCPAGCTGGECFKLGRVDLGYHPLAPRAFITPTPPNTPTNTPAPTAPPTATVPPQSPVATRTVTPEGGGPATATPTAESGGRPTRTPTPTRTPR